MNVLHGPAGGIGQAFQKRRFDKSGIMSCNGYYTVAGRNAAQLI